MLIDYVVWGHLFAVRFSLYDGLKGNCGKLGMLYCSVLRWAVTAPIHICGAALYLFCHTIPLHDLITK